MLVTVEIDFFAYMVVFAINPTKNEKEFLCENFYGDDFYLDDEIEADASCQHHHEMNVITIYTRKGKNSCGIRGLMSHEISHATSYIMEKYSVEDDEIRSMLCEFITNGLYNKDNIQRMGEEVS